MKKQKKNNEKTSSFVEENIQQILDMNNAPKNQNFLTFFDENRIKNN